MVIFLFGEDTFRASRKLREIISYYKAIHKSGINLKSFNEKDFDFQKFEEAFFSIGMFNEKKLFILKNIFSNKDFRERFYEEKEKFLASSNIVVIFEEREISKKDPLCEFLLKNAKWQEFNPLENEKLKKWVKKEILTTGIKIEPKALDKIIFLVGNDLWRLDNEIKKLIAFKKCEKISVEDVDFLVNRKLDTDIFKTISFLAKGKKEIALDLIHEHIKKGENPLYLLAMIAFQFRTLLQIRDLIERKNSYLKALKESNLPHLVFKNNYSLSQKFSLAQLKRIYEKIFQFEISTKTGKIEPEVALDLLIAEI